VLAGLGLGVGVGLSVVVGLGLGVDGFGSGVSANGGAVTVIRGPQAASVAAETADTSRNLLRDSAVWTKSDTGKARRSDA
jgi:hypothetical protein